ncbi:MAG: class I SAM-dependent methyltransferase [Geminicoccaceae bacterium]
MTASSTRLDRYITSEMHGIGGWLARCDAEIMATLLNAQVAGGLGGAVAEIGVHHGKSFILLALGNGTNGAYAIDIFGQQDLNIDKSGSGDKDIFLANARRAGLDTTAITIDERLSTDVAPADILSSVGKVRFFHIDGGHHFEAIAYDMKLAEATMAEHGIIAIDDMFRPEWPEVTFGTVAHLFSGTSDLVVFAIGFNKTYLCRKAFAERFRGALLGRDLLDIYLSKRYKISAEEILVYQRYPLPEWKLKKRVFHLLTQYAPELASTIWKKVRPR